MRAALLRGFFFGGAGFAGTARAVGVAGPSFRWFRLPPTVFHPSASCALVAFRAAAFA